MRWLKQFQVLGGQSRLWEVAEVQLQQRYAERNNPLLSTHLSYTAFLLPFVLKDPKKQPSLLPIKSKLLLQQEPTPAAMLALGLADPTSPNFIALKNLM